MANKLVLIYDEPFSTTLKVVANNERDLMDYLSENFKFTDMKIDSDNYISYKTPFGQKESIQLHWVKEI
jgi:thioredoxin-related protein